MKNRIFQLLLALTIFSNVGLGHEGRRFDVSVVDSRLVAIGYNNGAADGAPSIRPYANALHDHFTFFGSSSNPIGFADLPSWDLGTLPDADLSPLMGYEVNLTLVGSGKWINIPKQDGSGLNQDFGVPELKTLDADDLMQNPSEVIQIGFGSQIVDTLDLGNIELVANVAGVVTELDFEYFISNHNETEIYFIEWQLTTDAPGVLPSKSVYSIISPDGTGPVQRLHFQSLYLEEYLGTSLTNFTLGDVNQDGSTDLLDVAPFVSILTNHEFQAEADINQDGLVDLLDVSPFVALLTQ